MFHFTNGGMYFDVSNAHEIVNYIFDNVDGVITVRNGEEVLEPRYSFITSTNQMMDLASPNIYFDAKFSMPPQYNKVFERVFKKLPRGRPGSTTRKEWRKYGGEKLVGTRSRNMVPPPHPVAAMLYLSAIALKEYQDMKEDEVKEIIVNDLTSGLNQANSYGIKITRFMANQLMLGDEGLIPEDYRNKNDVVKLSNFLLDGTFGDGSVDHRSFHGDQLKALGKILFDAINCEEERHDDND